jgi:dTDP-L-rhamnose 4-epimerase
MKNRPNGKERAAGTGRHVLITGGAGFLGAHLTNELIDHGYRVRILDSLIPQVHGPGRKRPGYLHPNAELIVGDVRDAAKVKRALAGVDVVYHFAARVGVGQSMYEIDEYTSVNSGGTAMVLEHVIQQRIQRVIVASSMSIYGEGLYRTADGRLETPVDRTRSQLKAGDWEVRSAAGERLSPVPTPETKTPSLNSIYAISKWDQEQMCLVIGRAYAIPTVALRFFNIYGPHQALSNPYTGVLAIFASRLLNDSAPLVNEDGMQQRDFVSVYDIARACRLALESPIQGQESLNIGSGKIYTILELARRVARSLNKHNIDPDVTQKYRAGDIRHCFADIEKARKMLGYNPQVSLESGLADLARWLKDQTADDHVAEARAELAERGLMV